MPDFATLSGGPHAEALALLLTALAIDIGLGLVPGLARLVPDRLGLFAAAVGFLDRRLNRSGRSEVNLLVRGMLVTIVLVALAAGAGLLVARLGRELPYGWGLELLVLLLCLSARRLFADLRHGLRLTGSGDLAAGQALAARALGGDASRLDKYGVARAIVEAAATGFAWRVVAPAFWFALLGFPGLFVWRGVSRVAAASVRRDIPARAFGAAAIRLDHVLGLLPTVLAGALLSFAALVVPQAGVRRAFQVMLRDGARDEVVNDGRLKGAVAGALGLALGGPSGTKGGGGIGDAWIGDGRARVGQGDIRRMFYLAAVACLMLLGLVAAVTALRL